MSAGRRTSGRARVLALAAATVLSVSILGAGCGREPIAGPQSDANERAAADQVEASAVAVEQTTCPVMEGNPINKNLFVEYKGKKVYFCCAGCPETFLANPEKYIAKLPQFQEP